MDALSNELHQLLLERKDAQERGDAKKMEQVNMKIQQSGYMVRDTPSGPRISLTPQQLSQLQTQNVGRGRGRGRGEPSQVQSNGGSTTTTQGRGRGRGNLTPNVSQSSPALNTYQTPNQSQQFQQQSQLKQQQFQPQQFQQQQSQPKQQQFQQFQIPQTQIPQKQTQTQPTQSMNVFSKPIPSSGSSYPVGGPPMDDSSDEDVWDYGEELEGEGGADNEWETFGDSPADYRQSSHSLNDYDYSDYNSNQTSHPNDNYQSKEEERELAGLPENYVWKSSATRWETPSEGGVAKRDANFEKEVFSNQQSSGINFDKYDSIPVTVSGNNAPAPINSFSEAPLGDLLLDNVKLAKYTTPTPIQKYSIPIALMGRDLMGCAQTGSGKTAAFLLPTLALILRNPKPKSLPGERRVCPLILILAPTRELACQIFEESRKFAYRSHMQPCVVYGGAEIRDQIFAIQKGADILAATPGRLVDLMERGRISLAFVKHLILDEADRMLDLGFEPQIRRIIEKFDLPGTRNRQTLMFSATFPPPIQRLATEFLYNYLFLTVGRVGSASENITQSVVYVEENNKLEEITKLLSQYGNSRTLIFVQMKRTADTLDYQLRQRKFPITSIHGDLKQWEREEALKAFKSGTRPFLVATDVAARGLDISNVSLVVNYDLPSNIDDYIHRIGRTGRAGNTGKAISFFNQNNQNIARELMNVLKENKQQLPQFLETFAYMRTPFPNKSRRGGKSGGRSGGGGGGGGGRRFYGGNDFMQDPIDDNNYQSIDPADWDRMQKKKSESTPTKVYASVAYVDTSKTPSGYDEDDDDALDWGDDRIPRSAFYD